MTADPLHELFVLLVLLAGYTTLATAVWFILCHGRNAAVRKFNAALEAPAAASPAINAPESAPPDLHATLATLVAGKRLPAKVATKLLRIKPVFHDGRWVAYPSNAYWAHRFEHLHSR